MVFKENARASQGGSSWRRSNSRRLVVRTWKLGLEAADTRRGEAWIASNSDD